MICKSEIICFGVLLNCMCYKYTQHVKLEGSGACSTRETFENRYSEMASGGYAKSLLFVNINGNFVLHYQLIEFHI